jgi:gentisate 1,2-dioxygenase
MSSGPTSGGLPAAQATHEPWSRDAVYFEYSQAVDPVGSGAISAVPAERFGPELYSSGPSRAVPLDLSACLGVVGPATSPALCANFVRLCPGDELSTPVNASSQLFHVMQGSGASETGDGVLHWAQGDFFSLPARSVATHRATEPAVLYWVHDEPLMRYLGVTATERRFQATHYSHVDADHWLAQAAADPGAADRNRVSILLGNRALGQTLTVTHVLWAMFGLLPIGAVQPPHRHQSVALDLVLDCRPGCYTLLGDLDRTGKHLENVTRIDWEPGAAFVTPPGRWHSHHNESGAEARIVPIQDAGLHTFLRSLDIRFMTKDQSANMLAEVAPATVSSS